MIFNSLEFSLFILVVFLCYWFLFNKTLKTQNLFILISSYIFYGWWDWRFLGLIFFSTILDYGIGLKIYHCKNDKIRRLYLLFTILINLSLLGFFKYFNFFIDSWISLISLFGFFENDKWTLNIILPIGISFYTFQTMSYSIDIFYKRIKPTRDFISFASFVCFFPQLVAGPIERASNFLPQILKKRMFRYRQGVEGVKLILYGLFKKIVVADSLSPYVDIIFENYSNLDGGVLLLGLIYFSFQIYCDFSGYSDIAIGTAKLLGFELMSNFKYPFFSRDITEFWRKWHISMSSWFRDYLFMPMIIRYRSLGMYGVILATFLSYAIIGFWHGANYTFIIFGIYHAILFLPNIIIKKKSNNYLIFDSGNFKTNIKECYQLLKTFFLITISWVFFRSDTVYDSFNYLFCMITKISFPINNLEGLFFIIMIIVIDWDNRKNERDLFSSSSKLKRNFYYLFLVVMILLFSVNSGEQFIYFQF